MQMYSRPMFRYIPKKSAHYFICQPFPLVFFVEIEIFQKETEKKDKSI